MTIPVYQIIPTSPEYAANPAEPPVDAKRDRLFDMLDTLRHEAFALQNQLFKAPPHQATRLKRLLVENQAAQAAAQAALAEMGDVF